MVEGKLLNSLSIIDIPSLTDPTSSHCSQWRTPDYFSTRPLDHHNQSCAHNQTHGTESVPLGDQGRADQDSTSSRRRTQVAVRFLVLATHEHRRTFHADLLNLQCARCRKRKIKCSGPTGSIRTCVNCKNSGIDPKQCQFHRVRQTY